MSDFWYRNAVVYGVDVGTFLDSDGDGIGDFRGLTRRLDYLQGLGVSCLWLLPFFPSPNRDNGYDVTDYYGVDPRFGDLGDFVELLREAGSRGMRVMIDLVVDHTSDEHPWFRAARSDPSSPYRDYYVWTDEPPAEPRHRPIFPGVEDSVWTWDDEAGAYYFHSFYRFQPALNHANPAVREEVERIMGFWLQLGVAAFRVDAASHMVEAKGSMRFDGDPHDVLREYRAFAARRRGDVVLMGEADVEAGRLGEFFGRGDELNLLMNFLLNNYTWLALARKEAEPLVRALHLVPHGHGEGQWANFLRNLDEVDLERLTLPEREEVYRAFAPDEDMRIYGRGIRRRLAPMLKGDRKRIELAFSLLFSLPGTPLLVYGDEIGMGEDLALPEREAVRTAMQWSEDRNAGFSTADAERLASPVVQEGRFGYRMVNVAAQERDPGSLLNWMERLVRTRNGCPEWGWGDFRVLETADPAVFAHRCDRGRDALVAVHNLGGRPARVTLELGGGAETLVDLLGGEEHRRLRGTDHTLELEPYGYRWFRLGGTRSRAARPERGEAGRATNRAGGDG
ncbi:MAG TPA: alpha-amylase family protein [Longimicrobiaceae bacterium]|nr:alpha-amylase family protein [Longimicrobiaceae bacterium]